ncbi:MAG: hypothetical protein BLITH_1434 [Brockia lithotrophica]|uniref:Uncharacterized protein n=1 Tax=Brockia lithotrophica TaxID=933949 RepID=A0A2T5G3Y4_9BACL|nr:hypothetical protein [Brockia lithotrophica]PTQ50895.1 MAG: hypothetical protein BLITH_1434 [Brockia lithotrophica]
MAVHYAHARAFVGRPVYVVTADGRRHTGIVHAVTPTHLYLRPIRMANPGGRTWPYPPTLVANRSAEEEGPSVEPLAPANGEGFTLEPAQYRRGWAPWWPGYEAALIALPLFAILTLGLLFV